MADRIPIAISIGVTGVSAALVHKIVAANEVVLEACFERISMKLLTKGPINLYGFYHPSNMPKGEKESPSLSISEFPEIQSEIQALRKCLVTLINDGLKDERESFFPEMWRSEYGIRDLEFAKFIEQERQKQTKQIDTSNIHIKTLTGSDAFEKLLSNIKQSEIDMKLLEMTVGFH